MTTTTTYEVEKFCRDTKGQWFGRGARRFTTLAAAREYFTSFAAEQHDVLSNGIRIDLRERRGRRVLATVGGRLSHPAVIREIAAE